MAKNRSTAPAKTTHFHQKKLSTASFPNTYEVTVELAYRATFSIPGYDAKEAAGQLLLELSNKEIRKRAKKDPNNVTVKVIGKPVRLLVPPAQVEPSKAKKAS